MAVGPPGGERHVQPPVAPLDPALEEQLVEVGVQPDEVEHLAPHLHVGYVQVGGLATEVLRVGRPAHGGVEGLAPESAGDSGHAEPVPDGFEHVAAQLPHIFHLPFVGVVVYPHPDGHSRACHLFEREMLAQHFVVFHGFFHNHCFACRLGKYCMASEAVLQSPEARFAVGAGRQPQPVALEQRVAPHALAHGSPGGSAPGVSRHADAHAPACQLDNLPEGERLPVGMAQASLAVCVVGGLHEVGHRGLAACRPGVCPCEQHGQVGGHDAARLPGQSGLLGHVSFNGGLAWPRLVIDFFHGDYIRQYPKFCHGKPFLPLRWLRGGVLGVCHAFRGCGLCSDKGNDGSDKVSD